MLTGADRIQKVQRRGSLAFVGPVAVPGFFHSMVRYESRHLWSAWLLIMLSCGSLYLDSIVHFWLHNVNLMSKLRKGITLHLL